MVELAFVAPLLVLLSMGAIELGLGWRASLGVEQASRAGARAAAALGEDDQADREALRSIVAGFDAVELQQLDYIVIFDASGGADMPAVCAFGSTNACNRYTQTEIAALDDDTRWGCGSGDYDRHWCPTDRESYSHDPVDVGVRVVLSRDWVTGVLPGDGLTLDGQTTMRLPPLLR